MRWGVGTETSVSGGLQKNNRGGGRDSPRTSWQILHIATRLRRGMVYEATHKRVESKWFAWAR